MSRSQVRILLLTAALTWAVAGCAADPEPSPTEADTSTAPSSAATTPTSDAATTPSADPAQSHEDAQVAAAQAFVEHYYAESNAVRNDGGDWEARLAPFFTAASDLWAETRSGWVAAAAEGGHSTGSSVITAIQPTAWTEGPAGSGLDTVGFELCNDATGIVFYDAAGDELPDEQQPADEPFLVAVTVEGRPDSDLGWSLTAIAATGSSC